MSQPFSINFGPWVPDGADVAIGIASQYTPTNLPLADCLNVYWSDQGYRSLKTFGGVGTALGAQALGAFTAINSSAAPQIFAGTGSDLFQWGGSSFTNVSKSSGAYAGTAFWSFAEFAGCICAANGINLLQDMAIGGSNFADVTNSPIGYVIGAIGQFLLVGNIVSATLTSSPTPYRLYWSGIGDPTNWPTPLTDAAIAAESGYEDLTQEFGAIMFIAPGPLQGLVFQQTGITRLNYVGGDVVFQFAPIERKRGLVAKGAAVQVGELTHFLSGDGFYMTDGSQVIPTGAATDGSIGLDRWFWANVNTSALNAISAGWDATLKCVVFAIPTGSNTEPDTLLLLNPRDSRWTRAQIANELIWPDNTGTQHRLGLFSQSHQLGYLTGTPNSGYCETYDGSFLDGRVRDVVEAQPNVLCRDSPTMRIGYREAIQDAITYSPDNPQNSFSRRVTWDPPPAGRFVRARVTSAAATALNGCTIFTEMGGV